MRRLQEETIEQIKKMHKEGFRQDHIAKTLSVHISTVSLVIRSKRHAKKEHTHIHKKNLNTARDLREYVYKCEQEDRLLDINFLVKKYNMPKAKVLDILKGKILKESGGPITIMKFSNVHGHSKFNINQVNAIRKAHKEGATQSELAKKYKCSPTTIYYLLHKKTYNYTRV